jgi:hypothetical protein
MAWKWNYRDFDAKKIRTDILHKNVVSILLKIIAYFTYVKYIDISKEN